MSKKYVRDLLYFSVTMSALTMSSLSAAPITINVAGDTNLVTNGTFNAGTMSGDLRGALNFINQTSGSYNITFNLGGSNTISLGTNLPILNLNAPNTVQIDGSNGGSQIIIDGSAALPGFFAEKGSITLENLTLQNLRSTGGVGGSGAGGGGMGAGGALFIDQAAVTISNVTINSCSAQGGQGTAAAGGISAGGGGGGFWGCNVTGQGAGGNVGAGATGGGGGGGGGIGGAGGKGDLAGGRADGGGGGGIWGTSQGGNIGFGGPIASNLDDPHGLPGGGFGAASGGSVSVILGGLNAGGGSCTAVPGTNTAGAGGGAGGGSIFVQSGPGGPGGFGGGGGGGCSTLIGASGTDGGNGGFGGGGGGGGNPGNLSPSGNGAGGNGGFGGGGGGAGNSAKPSGNGGFGGGGAGSGMVGQPGIGGVGGGHGAAVGSGSGGGGGAGFGGGIFLNSGFYNAGSAGSLTILGPFSTNASNTTTRGTGSPFAGFNAGNDAFLLTGTTIILDPNGSSITFTNSIADDSPSSFDGVPLPPSFTLGTQSGAILSIGTANPAGTVNLVAANTYQGGTTLNKGTVAISNNNSLGTGVLNFSTNNGNILKAAVSGLSVANAIHLNVNGIVDTNGNTMTLTGNITLAGSLTKQNTGTLRLAVAAGTNTYSGGTVISAGTLEIDSVASLPTGGNVDLPGASAILNLSTAGGGAVTIGDLTGIGGSSVNLGASPLTFGTATLSAIFGGTVSGTGSLIKQGSGTAIFSGTNNYSGGTTINGGTFEVTGAGILNSTGFVNVNASGAAFDITTAASPITIGDLSSVSGSNINVGANTLTFGTGNSTTFSGSFNGAGTLIKQGSGTFTVDGTNAFTGTFDVNAGTLRVASTGLFPPASTTTIASGATLAGTGTLGTVILNGTVSPGDSIGTIHTGDFSFNSGSNYIVELSDTSSDLVASSGTVTINSGSILNLVSAGLSMPQSSYTIITSTLPIVRNGDFILNNPFPRFNFRVQYDPNDVMLILTSMTNFVAKGNAAGAANCFNAMLGNSDLQPIISILSMQTQSQLQKSFNQMQPAELNAIGLAQENVAERIRQIYSRHFFKQKVITCPALSCTPPPPPEKTSRAYQSSGYYAQSQPIENSSEPLCHEQHWHFWAAPFVERVHQSGNSDLKGYKEEFAGVTAAADYQMKHWIFTGGFSYAGADVHVKGGDVQGDFNTYAGTVGALWAGSGFFADGLVSYLFSTADATREMEFGVVTPTFSGSAKTDINFSGFAQTKAKHSQDSNEVVGHLGGGYDFKWSRGTRHKYHLYPFIDVDYIYIDQDGFKEHGADGLDLMVKGKRYDLLRPDVGIGFVYAGCWAHYALLGDASISYAREFRFLGKKTKSNFVGNKDCFFTVRGLNPKNNLICPTASFGVATTGKNTFSLTLTYYGEYGKHFIENAGEIELKAAF